MQFKFIDYVFIAAIALLTFLGLRACDRKQVKSITDTNLKPTEQVAVAINPRSGEVTTIRRDRKNKKETTITQKQARGARDIRISVSPQGRVVVTARTKGFIHEPGFVAGYGHPGLRVGGDVQFAFWNVWGLHVGLTTTNRWDIKPFIGGSYALNVLDLNNTSVLVGFDSNKQILVGLRVQL